VGHALLSPLVGAASVELLQMAFAASELPIADVRPLLDFTRVRAGVYKDTLEV